MVVGCVIERKLLACLLFCVRHKMRYVGCVTGYKVLACLLLCLRYKMRYVGCVIGYKVLAFFLFWSTLQDEVRRLC